MSEDTSAMPRVTPSPHLVDELESEEIPTPWWYKALGWVGVVALIWVLILGVNVMSRGFRGLGTDTAHALFGFASNPLVALCVGLLATVIVQSSSTTTAITVTAVGSGVLTLAGGIPIILGSNLGTTVTCTLVALGFVGNRDDFRRALAASTMHDFYNLLALLIFFPLEVVFHPLARLSALITNGVYGTTFLPDPSRFNLISLVTSPVVSLISSGTSGISSRFGPAIMIVLGVLLILVAIRYLGRLLRTLMVGAARRALIRAVTLNQYLALVIGLLVTAVGTQSSTVTQSILVPFAGAGVLKPRQIYPVTVGANLGTTFTALLAAFAVTGSSARLGLEAGFVHFLYNVLSAVIIFVIPVLRPVAPFCAELLARVAVDRKWAVAVWVVGVFVVLPILIIVGFAVF